MTTGAPVILVAHAVVSTVHGTGRVGHARFRPWHGALGTLVSFSIGAVATLAPMAAPCHLR